MAMEAAVHDDKPRQQDTSLRVGVVLENTTPEARAEVVRPSSDCWPMASSAGHRFG
jgi:hypothetical protein